MYKYFIEKLHLEPHPEGGYFKRFLEAKDTVDGERKLWSSTYYLLKDFDVNLLKENEEVTVIFSESFSKEGFGMAVMNRLMKAAGFNIIKDK